MDPRVDHDSNDAFLDQMEQYYTLRSQQFDAKLKIDEVYDGTVVPSLGLQFIYQ